MWSVFKKKPVMDEFDIGDLVKVIKYKWWRKEYSTIIYTIDSIQSNNTYTVVDNEFNHGRFYHATELHKVSDSIV